MWLLIGGIFLWSMIHLSSCLAPETRGRLVDRIGADPYKGLFSLLIIASLVLIVLGWRGSVPYPVYDPPQWGRLLTVVLMALSIYLFVASSLPTNLKRFMRHPQLISVALWGAAHLLTNGDRRSLVLFGSLAIWSIAEIILINRRDGAWVKPKPVPVANDLLPVAIGIAMFALLVWLHPYFAGMSVLIR